MQKIVMNLADQDIEIQSVDGEIAEGCSGSVELQINNVTETWTSGKVWATFTKGDVEISHLTAKVGNEYVTDVPDAIFEDDRNFGIFVWYLGGQNYVETRRVLRISIAETGKIPDAIETVSSEEASKVMQMLKSMETMYKVVENSEKDRYNKYYKAEGIDEKEFDSENFKSRQKLYEEAEGTINDSDNKLTRWGTYYKEEKIRNNNYMSAEKKRDSEYSSAEEERNSAFAASESIRQSNESVRADNEEIRQANDRERESAEQGRQNAEEVREANEAKREAALNKILVPGSETIVNRAECDDEGNKIGRTYARKEKLDNLIVFGNVVARAECDDLGNKIRLTYARKDEIQEGLNIVQDIDSISGDEEKEVVPSARAVKIHASYVFNDAINYVDRNVINKIVNDLTVPVEEDAIPTAKCTQKYIEDTASEVVAYVDSAIGDALEGVY